MSNKRHAENDEDAECEGVDPGRQQGSASADEKAPANCHDLPPKVLLAVRLHDCAEQRAQARARNGVVGGFELAVFENNCSVQKGNADSVECDGKRVYWLRNARVVRRAQLPRVVVSEVGVKVEGSR